MANIKDLLGEAYKEDMTNDEIVEALANVSLPQDNSDELKRYKDAVSKANSEAADYKRKLKERMSEEEKKASEDAERYAKLEAENKELNRRILVADYTSKFLASGMDQEMASESAEAAFNGDFDTVIANFNTQMASVKETVKAELLNSTPSLVGGNTTKVKDYSNEIAAAVSGNDMATAVALTRLQQTNTQNLD